MRRIAEVLLLVLFSTGCRTHNLSRAFIPQPAVISAPKTEMLLVEFPAENRPLKGKSKIAPGLAVLIPLVPYGHQILTPERYMRGRYKYAYSFNKDLQDAIIKDIQASGLVREVRGGDRKIKDTRVSAMDFAPVFQWEGGSNSVPKGCKILSLRLNEGVMNRYVTTYGLSFVVFPFWMIGAPTAYCDFDLQVTAQLRDGTGQVLAERSFLGKKKYVELMYTASSSGLSAIPPAYGEISIELREFLKANL